MEPTDSSSTEWQSNETVTLHDSPAVLQPSPTDNEKTRPMKHLTCFFWYHYVCKYKEESCLYAHRETGHIASAPCQVEPGTLKPYSKSDKALAQATFLLPGHSIAGSNLQNYLNHQQPVYKDHRGALGLGEVHRRDTVTSHRTSIIDPAIRQQIDHITAKVQIQKQQFIDSYNQFAYNNRFNPLFANFIHGTTAEEVYKAGPFGAQAIMTQLPDTPFSPEQASPGIFSPTTQDTGLTEPTEYSLPAPPAPTYYANHDECDQQHQELQAKVDNLVADNERLRKANDTLVKALLGTTLISERNAMDMQKFCRVEGIKLMVLVKYLLKKGPLQNSPELIQARNVLIGVGKSIANYKDKLEAHLSELADARFRVRAAIVDSGNEEVLALWDAGHGAWPFQDRLWGRYT